MRKSLGDERDDEERDTLSELPNFRRRMKRHHARHKTGGKPRNLNVDLRGVMAQLAEALSQEAFDCIIKRLDAQSYEENVAFLSQFKTQ